MTGQVGSDRAHAADGDDADLDLDVAPVGREPPFDAGGAPAAELPWVGLARIAVAWRAPHKFSHLLG